MKHKLLSLIIMTAGMSMVACSDDKGQPVAQCGTQACSMQKAALAQVPGSPENTAMLKAGIIPPGAPALKTGPLAQIPGAVDPATGLKLASNAQIRAQSAKVSAALEADSHNPDSPYYVGDGTSGTPAAAERAPASVSIQTSSVAEVPLAPQMAQGGGEATH